LNALPFLIHLNRVIAFLLDGIARWSYTPRILNNLINITLQLWKLLLYLLRQGIAEPLPLAARRRRSFLSNLHGINLPIDILIILHKHIHEPSRIFIWIQPIFNIPIFHQHTP
jgi:hypothetical protein